MDDTYYPCPVWDGFKWVGVDYTKGIGDGPDGFVIVPWLDDLDGNNIEPPKFNLGDTVKFKWGAGEGLKTGIIQAIRKNGGTCGIEKAIEYYEREPHYFIYWNGHGRQVDERNIVG